MPNPQSEVSPQAAPPVARLPRPSTSLGTASGIDDADALTVHSPGAGGDWQATGVGRPLELSGFGGLPIVTSWNVAPAAARPLAATGLATDLPRCRCAWIRPDRGGIGWCAAPPDSLCRA
jgi:hypothetical protein